MKAPCKYPGCPAILERLGYCPKHEPTIEQGRKAHADFYDRFRRRGKVDLAQAQAIRSSARWKKVRWLKLSMQPICEDPHGWHAKRRTAEIARQVHHIKPAGTNPELAYDPDNLMSVCHKCHAKLERDAKTSQNDPENTSEMGLN